MRQLKLNLDKGTYGGRRKNAGRKRIHSKGVAHRPRESVNSRTPVHVNFKFRTHVRTKDSLKVLKHSIENARRHGLRVIHWSLQSNHVHFILEPVSNAILTKGMRSLTISFSKGLKKGSIQIERYHLHVLRSLRETKNSVHYVLFNKQKHEKGRYSVIDEYCSLLSLPDALMIIRKFAVKNRMTLSLLKGQSWKRDLERTFLLRSCFS